MLTLAAAPLGIECHIFSASPDDPGAQVTSHWTQGSLSNPAQLAAFAKKVDSLTFESEFVDTEILSAALKKLKIAIYPSLEVVKTLQDRATQKQTLLKYKVATTPFLIVDTKEDLTQAFDHFRGKFVLKLRRNGYDGNGTFYCRNQNDLQGLKPLIQKHSQGFIAEAFVPFRRECALMVFRSNDGSFSHFPLVETFQKDSRCDWVLGPETHPELPAVLSRLKQMMKGLQYVGALGVELFDDGQQLLVNELAPRVHNSGHYSQNSLSQDQFSMHLKAGLGERLQTAQPLRPFFGMVNLIGQSQKPVDLFQPDGLKSALHWYAKSENRKGRKMGHLNWAADTKRSVLQTLLRERKRFQL